MSGGDDHDCGNCGKLAQCAKAHANGWCSAWTPFSPITFIDKIKDALPKEDKKFSLDKLIDAHWKYVEMTLITHLVDPAHLAIPKEIQVAEFHYRTAFRHGWKHALEHYGIEEKSDE